MKYAIEITATAARQIRHMDRPIQARVLRVIEALADDPHPPASVRIKGTDEFRLRTGDYRIIYRIYEDRLLIEITDAGPRQSIYRNR